MKKLLYIGHTFHQKTKSNRFFLDVIKDNYDITYLLYDPYTRTFEGLEEARAQEYDVVFMWQTFLRRSFLKRNFKYGKVIFAPMYDALPWYFPWVMYKDYKVLCFCKRTYDRLMKMRFDALYVKYMMKPEENQQLGDERSVFLWQRRESINVNMTMKLMEEQDINHIHIHKAVDPGYQLIEPQLKGNNIKFTYSEWFDDSNGLKDKMRESTYYMAPRKKEGIGMGFLEALAQGRCVIAPNSPTMNEYIQDGYNGLLYDPRKVRALPRIEDVRTIQKNALKQAKADYEAWEESKRIILEWMSNGI